MATPQRHNHVALTNYDAACRALANAKSVDEARNIRNAAVALKVYAKQAKNRQLELDAIAVRKRAERRIGELMKAGKEAGSFQRGGDRKSKVTDGPLKPITIQEIGIDKHLADRGRQMAALSPEQFEEHVESIRHNVHLSTGQPEHYTPRVIIDAVLACFDGVIDLDPCCENRTIPNVPARLHYTQREDGLKQPWSGRVYMNPPYGRKIDAWIEKLCAEHHNGNVTQAIALVPARTDTQWFKRLRDFVCCFVEGRLTFSGSDPAPFPSAVFYLGENIEMFYFQFVSFGDIWQRLEPGMFAE